jgi:hypothetical protein
MAAILTAKRRNYDSSSCQGIALVIFASKRSEIQVYFFAFFRFKFFASKGNEGENFFASKEAKFNIFCIMSLPNFVSGEKKTFLSIFSLNFRFATIFSPNFRLFYLRFRFRFLVFRIEVNHVKSGFFFASKRNEIFASISNFASEVKVRAHPSKVDWGVGTH